MNDDEVIIEKDGEVAWIILNRPDKRNAQGVTFTSSLLAALDRVERDREVSAAILTGAGPVFGGGGDLKEIMNVEQSDPEWEFELIRGYNTLISRLYYFERPIIAAVNGPAIGGGACLALACDFALAAEQGAYHFAFGRIGLSGADMGAPYLLQRHVGAARASHLMLTGAQVDARQGVELGLFLAAVPADRLRVEALRIAQSIAAQSRRATTITKMALRRAPEAGLAASLEYEAYMQSFAFRSEGHKERLAAFLKPRAGKA